MRTMKTLKTLKTLKTSETGRPSASAPAGAFRLRGALGLDRPVLGVWYVNQVPPDAATVIEGRSKAAVRGCAMFLISRAFDGFTVAFTPESALCPGASRGLGLPPNPRESFPGGMEAMYRYLANGNACTAEGRAEAERLRAEGFRESAVREFLEGEGLKESYELAAEYYRETLPPIEPETGVLMMRPIGDRDLERPPKLAVMLVDALQLSALVVLVNFARPGMDSLRIPLAPGCASLVAVPLHEAAQETPRAVVGLVDIDSRRHMGGLLRRTHVSVSVPWPLYLEMERNVDSSFLSRKYWKGMAEHT
jgi:hypothetical protein